MHSKNNDKNNKPLEERLFDQVTFHKGDGPMETKIQDQVLLRSSSEGVTAVVHYEVVATRSQTFARRFGLRPTATGQDPRVLEVALPSLWLSALVRFLYLEDFDYSKELAGDPGALCAFAEEWEVEGLSEFSNGLLCSMTKPFANDNQLPRLLHSLYWQNQEACNVIVGVPAGEGPEFHASRSVLIAGSGFFANLFSPDWAPPELNDQGQYVVSLDGVAKDGQVLEAVLTTLYGVPPPLSPGHWDRVADLFDLAGFLQVGGTEESFCAFLVKETTLSNAPLIWNFCDGLMYPGGHDAEGRDDQSSPLRPAWEHCRRLLADRFLAATAFRGFLLLKRPLMHALLATGWIQCSSMAVADVVAVWGGVQILRQRTECERFRFPDSGADVPEVQIKSTLDRALDLLGPQRTHTVSLILAENDTSIPFLPALSPMPDARLGREEREAGWGRTLWPQEDLPVLLGRTGPSEAQPRRQAFRSEVEQYVRDLLPPKTWLTASNRHYYLTNQAKRH